MGTQAGVIVQSKPNSVDGIVIFNVIVFKEVDAKELEVVRLEANSIESQHEAKCFPVHH